MEKQVQKNEKETNGTASEVEEEKLKKEEIIEDIQSNRMIPQQYKDLLIQNIDLPERVQALEGMLVKFVKEVNVGNIANEVVANLQKASEERRQRAEERASQANEPGQGPGGLGKGQMGNLIQTAIASILRGQGGASKLDDFFMNIGRDKFLRSMAYGDLLVEEQAKAMGKDFAKRFVDRVEKLRKASEGSESGV